MDNNSHDKDLYTMFSASGLSTLKVGRKVPDLFGSGIRPFVAVRYDVGIPGIALYKGSKLHNGKPFTHNVRSGLETIAKGAVVLLGDPRMEEWLKDLREFEKEYKMTEEDMDFYRLDNYGILKARLFLLNKISDIGDLDGNLIRVPYDGFENSQELEKTRKEINKINRIY